MSNQMACPTAIKNLNTTRGKYLKACYVIRERLVGYNNYLLETAFRTRIPLWIKNNDRLIDSLFSELQGSNDYVSEKYLEMINGKMTVNPESRKKKNKVPIYQIPNVDVWVSKHKLTYEAAVRWFRNNVGIKKKQLLLELAARHAYIIDDQSVLERDPIFEIVEDIYDASEEQVKKEWRRGQKEYRRLVGPSKPSKFRERRNKMLYRRVLRDPKELDKKSIATAVRYLQKKDPLNDLEGDIFKVLATYPCQEQFFLTGVAWEQYYSELGPLESSLAFAMRQKRNDLAKIGVFDYRTILDLATYDRFLAHEYAGADLVHRLPNWCEYAIVFTLDNTYKRQPLKYLHKRCITEIKNGSYVNVLQLYKNNGITTSEYLDLSLLQRMTRKQAKKQRCIVLDKHQYRFNMINDLNQQIPNLMAAAHAKVRYKNVAEKVFDSYFTENFSLGVDSFLEAGKKTIRRRKVVAALKWGQMSHQEAYKSMKEAFDLDPSIGRAAAALNDLESTRMNIDNFVNRSYAMLEAVKDIEAIHPMVPPGYGDLNTAYCLNWSPTYLILIRRIIKFLIGFLKLYKARMFTITPELRRYSKPLRLLEEYLLVRHRPLWDLIETGKIYVKVEPEIVRGGDSKEFKEFFEATQSEVGSIELLKVLRKFSKALNNRNPMRAREKKWSYLRDTSFTDSFKAAVAKAFNVTNYLYVKSDLMATFPMKIRFEEGPTYNRNSVALTLVYGDDLVIARFVETQYTNWNKAYTMHKTNASLLCFGDDVILANS